MMHLSYEHQRKENNTSNQNSPSGSHQNRDFCNPTAAETKSLPISIYKITSTGISQKAGKARRSRLLSQ
ncbi:hypothetical protein YC2023_011954 [Brassica napus]